MSNYDHQLTGTLFINRASLPKFKKFLLLANPEHFTFRQDGKNKLRFIFNLRVGESYGSGWLNEEHSAEYNKGDEDPGDFSDALINLLPQLVAKESAVICLDLNNNFPNGGNLILIKPKKKPLWKYVVGFM